MTDNDFLYKPIIFLEQLALSVVIYYKNYNVLELSNLYNCPLHHLFKLTEDIEITNTVQWHHNNYLYSSEIVNLIIQESKFEQEKEIWIKSQNNSNCQLTVETNNKFIKDFNLLMNRWRNDMV